MRLLVHAALLPALASTLAAQEPALAQPSAVPTDLAVALAAAGGFGNASEPQILVGAIPEWVTAKIRIPENWRILGSAFMGSTVVGVMQVGTAADSLIVEFDRHQTGLGWKAPPPRYEGWNSGFQIAPAPATPVQLARGERRITRCSDGQTLTVWVSRERSLSTTIAFRMVSTNPSPTSNTTCNPFQPPPETRERTRPPTLFNPAAVRELYDRSCADTRGFDEGMTGATTHFKLPMTAEQLLAHYAKQLADSGWTPGPGSQRTVTVRQTWTKPDSTGRPLNLYVEVTIPPQDTTCRNISLMMSDRRR